MDKSQVRFVEVKHFGMVSSETDADMLKMEATSWVCKISGQLEIDFDDSKGCELEETKCTIGNMDSVLINDTQLLLSLVYDSIGFNRIPTRTTPVSYLPHIAAGEQVGHVGLPQSYYDEVVDLNAIY